jgi:hypothetical protein
MEDILLDDLLFELEVFLFLESKFFLIFYLDCLDILVVFGIEVTQQIAIFVLDGFYLLFDSFDSEIEVIDDTGFLELELLDFLFFFLEGLFGN